MRRVKLGRNFPALEEDSARCALKKNSIFAEFDELVTRINATDLSRDCSLIMIRDFRRRTAMIMGDAKGINLAHLTVL